MEKTNTKEIQRITKALSFLTGIKNINVYGDTLNFKLDKSRDTLTGCILDVLNDEGWIFVGYRMEERHLTFTKKEVFK